MSRPHNGPLLEPCWLSPRERQLTHVLRDLILSYSFYHLARREVKSPPGPFHTWSYTGPSSAVALELLVRGPQAMGQQLRIHTAWAPSSLGEQLHICWLPGTSLSTRTNTVYMFTSKWHCSSELFATEKGPGGAMPSLSSAGKTNTRNALSFPAAVLASLSALSAPHSPNHPTNSLADFLLSLIFKSN